jgi:hypothetical protein
MQFLTWKSKFVRVYCTYITISNWKGMIPVEILIAHAKHYVVDRLFETKWMIFEENNKKNCKYKKYINQLIL